MISVGKLLPVESAPKDRGGRRVRSKRIITLCSRGTLPCFHFALICERCFPGSLLDGLLLLPRLYREWEFENGE